MRYRPLRYRPSTTRYHAVSTLEVNVRETEVKMSETRPKQELQPIVIRLPIDLHERLKRKAEEEERTMSQTMRRALKRYLEAEDQAS